MRITHTLNPSSVADQSIVRLLRTDQSRSGPESKAGLAEVVNAAAWRRLELAGDGEHGWTNHGPSERAGLQSVLDSEGIRPVPSHC